MQDFLSPDQIKLYRKQVGALCNAGQFKKAHRMAKNLELKYPAQVVFGYLEAV
jgi:hypothetical protein